MIDVKTSWNLITCYGTELKWISAEKKSNLDGGGFYVLAAKEKMIQALSLWLNDLLNIRRVNVEADFDGTEFTTISMTEMID